MRDQTLQLLPLYNKPLYKVIYIYYILRYDVIGGGPTVRSVALACMKQNGPYNKTQTNQPCSCVVKCST